jgi:predicted DsbA family dithiol-disulfide isomerase
VGAAVSEPDGARHGGPLAIEVISDVVCPWCYVGKRRLDKAVAAAGIPLTVRWRPFQLDSTIPPEGKPRREYMLAKFGSAARIQQIHDALAETGRADGISFDFDRIEVSPNTLDAHRLVRWAEADGVQDAVVEALFRAYFLEGRDVGDRSVLAEIAGNCWMDPASVTARLASEEDCQAVRVEIEAAQRMGVTGVPTFILAGRYALVGAQPADEIAAALRRIAGDRPREERLLA